MAKNKIEWKSGEMVRIGNQDLIVTDKIETPKGEPNAFNLETLDRTRHYRFQPYRGLRRVA